jgi:hypothetical protein
MSVYAETQTVPEGALTKVVTHNLNDAAAVVARATPSWLTRTRTVSRDANTLTLGFNVEAPAGGGELDIRIIG